MNDELLIQDLKLYTISFNVTNAAEYGKIYCKINDQNGSILVSFFDEKKKFTQIVVDRQNFKYFNSNNFKIALIEFLINEKLIFDRKLFLTKFENFVEQLPDQSLINQAKLFEQKLMELNEHEDDEDIDSSTIEELDQLRKSLLNLGTKVDLFKFEPKELFGYEIMVKRMQNFLMRVLEMNEKGSSVEFYFDRLGLKKNVIQKIVSFITNKAPDIIPKNKELDFSEEVKQKKVEHDKNCKDLKTVLDEMDLKKALKDQIMESFLEIENYSKEYRKCSKISLEDVEIKSNLNRTIAVICRANESATNGNRLRIPQIISLLVFLINKTEKGHISEISTGEGKTTIISCLAAIKVLQGFNVHVITSNEVLAQEAIKDRSKFYSLLGISVSHNQEKCKGAKRCYSSNVVYGSMANFQFDWLTHNAKDQGTLGQADYEKTWIILDEIDSLMIDQGGHIARLSQKFPGMEYIRYVYIEIWVKLEKEEQKVYNHICALLNQKAEELSKQSWLSVDQKQIEYDDYKMKLVENVLDKIKEKILGKKSKLVNTHLIPDYLHNYVFENIENWIECAFKAKYVLNENVEYKICKKDNHEIIVPIDNQNTGVSMPDSIYSNVLHQFLQLKHNLKLTSESLNSCYISNIGYVKKYKNKMYGLTGTLGSKSEKKFLQNIYDLNFSKIPTYKTKKFEMFPGRVFRDAEFDNKIALAALGEIFNRERAVLIICSSIKQVYSIEKEIKKEAKRASLKTKILKYRDEIDAHITEKKIKPGNILIATNISGRGTDLKTSKSLEQNGGLHVILAYLAANQRVQDQAMGRTSRQGNAGTGQILISFSEVKDLFDANSQIFDLDALEGFESILKLRDESESKRLKFLQEHTLAEIEYNDFIFDEFIKYQKLLKQDDENKTFSKIKEKLNDNLESQGISYKFEDNLRKIYVGMDLEERWALWLQKNSFNSNMFSKNQHVKDLVKEKFNEFKSLTKESIEEKKIQYNPYYSILLAQKYAENGSFNLSRDEIVNSMNICKSDLIHCAISTVLFELEIEQAEQIKKRYYKALEEIFKVRDSKSKEKYEFEVAKIKTISFDEYKKKYEFEVTKIKTISFDEYKKNAVIHLNRAKESYKIEQDYLEDLFKSDSLSMIATKRYEKNSFIFDLQARYTCLNIYMRNIDSLKEQIEKFEEEKDEDGELVIGVKCENYLKRLDSNLEHEQKIKKIIFEENVEELANVGLRSIYELRKIYDVNKEVIQYARIQIYAGISLLGAGAVCPFLLSVNGPLASVFISEGVTDIILALLNQGHTKFDRKAYIKSKIVSYSISFLCLGIKALLQSTTFLTKALKACRSLAENLRRVGGPFASVCNFVANQLDKLANAIELIIKQIEFSRMTLQNQKYLLSCLKDSGNLKEFHELAKILKSSHTIICSQQIIKGILISSTVETAKNVAISVAIDKVISYSLDKLLSGLKQKIKQSIKERLNESKSIFLKYSLKDHKDVLEKLFETTLSEDIEEILKNVSLGLLKSCQDWRVQLALHTVEIAILIKDLIKCSNALCDKYISLLKSKDSKNDLLTSKEFDEVVKNVSGVFTNIIYGKLLAFSGSLIKTIPKIIKSRLVQNSEKEEDAKKFNKLLERSNKVQDSVKNTNYSNCVHTAASSMLGVSVESLSDACGIAPSESGATIEDAKKMFSELSIETVQVESYEDAKNEMLNSGSDRLEVFICYEDGSNHATACFLEENEIYFADNGEKICLNEYLNSSKISRVSFLVPKNLNEQDLQERVLPHFYQKRIENSWCEIKFSGNDQGVLFQGGKSSKSNELPPIKKNKGLEDYKFKDGNGSTDKGIDVDLRQSKNFEKEERQCKNFDECKLKTGEAMQQVLVKMKEAKIFKENEFEAVKKNLIEKNKIYDELINKNLHVENKDNLNEVRKIDVSTEINVPVNENKNLNFVFHLNLDIDPNDNGPCTTHLGYKIDYNGNSHTGHVFISNSIIPRKYFHKQ